MGEPPARGARAGRGRCRRGHARGHRARRRLRPPPPPPPPLRSPGREVRGEGPHPRGTGAFPGEGSRKPGAPFPGAAAALLPPVPSARGFAEPARSWCHRRLLPPGGTGQPGALPGDCGAHAGPGPAEPPPPREPRPGAATVGCPQPFTPSRCGAEGRWKTRAISPNPAAPRPGAPAHAAPPRDTGMRTATAAAGCQPR